MATSGRTLTVYLAADTRGAAREIDTFASKVSRFAKIGAVAAAAGMAILAKETWDFAQASAEAAREAQVSEARLRNIVRSMGFVQGEYRGATERVLDYASALSATIGVEDESIQLVQSKLATFKALGQTINETGGAFDRATQAAFDLAAAGFGTAEQNAVQLGKALNDPIRGLTALARAGITFTDAEKARIASLVESNRLGEAQALVLAAIEKQVGGTAEATATAQGKMGVAWGELQEQIGASLLPAFDSIATTLTESVIPALSDLWKRVAPSVERALDGLAEWFRTDGADDIKAFGEWLTTDGKQAWDNMTGYVGSVGDALGDIVDDIDRVKAAFTTGGGTGDDGGLAGIVNNVASALGWLYDQGAMVFGWRRIPGIIDAVATAIVNVWNAIQDFVDWSSNLDETIDDIWRSIGEAIVSGFKAGVSGLTGVIDWIQEKMMGMPAGIFDILGIHSPSRVFIDIGGNIVKGFEIGVSGLKDATDKVASRFTDMSERVQATINDMADRAKDRLANAQRDFADFAAGVSASLMGALQLTTTEAGAFDPTAWAKQLQTSVDWGQELKRIADDPAYGDTLVSMIADMGPEAGMKFVQSLTPAMVQQLNTDLTNVSLISDTAAAAMAERFKGQGVTDAQAYMDGLDERITERLEWLYRQGRKMGLAVSRGFRDATGLLSSAAGVSGSDAATRSSGSVVNVTVQAGVGNPVEIARTIENVLRSRSIRLGVA